MKIFSYSILLLLILILGCQGPLPTEKEGNLADKTKELPQINLYSYRYFTTDQKLFQQFETTYKVKVNVYKATSEEILAKLEDEQNNPKADLVLLDHIGFLEEAKNKGLLQPFSATQTEENVADKLKDRDGYWVSVTKDLLAIAYQKESVKEERLIKLQNLTQSKWKNKIALSKGTSKYSYATSLAAMLQEGTIQQARRMTKTLVSNATILENDFEVIKAIANGEQEVGLVNVSSWVQFTMNGDPENFELGEKVGLRFPENKEGRTYFDAAGIGVVKNSPNWEIALSLIDRITSNNGQTEFANTIRAYPVNPMVIPNDFLIGIGGFRETDLSLDQVANSFDEAMSILNETNWK